MIYIRTQSPQETKKIASLLARQATTPLIIALRGALGSGKTTFVQGFARALGVKEKVQSPTFVLMKVYRLNQKIKHLVHIDCYRLGSPKDLLHLGFKDLLKDKDAIILIEWAERVKNFLPRSTLWMSFAHGRKPNERLLRIYEKTRSH